MFGDEFRQCIESDLMKREPYPDAKPMGAFSIAGANLAHESHDHAKRRYQRAGIRSRKTSVVFVYGLRLLLGVIGDCFSYIERGRLPTHVIGADVAFGDDTRDGGLETRCALGFVEPVEHQLRC
jgi:hypothetical protein